MDAEPMAMGDSSPMPNPTVPDASPLDGGSTVSDAARPAQDMAVVADSTAPAADTAPPVVDGSASGADASEESVDAALPPSDAGDEDGPEDGPGGGNDMVMMDYDLGACLNGMCPMPTDDRANDGPPDGGDWATSMGEQCTLVAKVNADLQSGLNLSNNRTPDDAVTALETCLQAEGCYDADNGFGPPQNMRDNEEAWRRCFDALCACNNQIIDGPPIMCELTYIFGNRRASPRNCNAPGSIAIFKIPPSRRYPNGGSHAVTVTGHDLVDGEHVLTLRDPNCPDQTGDALVDMNGEVTETLGTELPEGATLSACFTFR